MVGTNTRRLHKANQQRLNTHTQLRRRTRRRRSRVSHPLTSHSVSVRMCSEVRRKQMLINGETRIRS